MKSPIHKQNLLKSRKVYSKNIKRIWLEKRSLVEKIRRRLPQLVVLL